MCTLRGFTVEACGDSTPRLGSEQGVGGSGGWRGHYAALHDFTSWTASEAIDTREEQADKRKQ